MILNFLLLSACSKYAPVQAGFQLPQHQYHIQTVGFFENKSLDGVLSSEASPKFSVSMDWQVALAAAEQLRDDSAWMRLTVTKADYAVNDAPISSSAEGKIVDLRVFPWGELLSVRYMDYLSGDGRWLDVFEPILPSLFPNLPNLKKGETKQQEQRWPIVEGEQTIVRAANRINWHRMPDEGELWVYSYEGIWLPNSRGNLQMQTGTVKGQVWILPEDPWIIKHQFNWARHIIDNDNQKQQSQTFTGEVRRTSP